MKILTERMEANRTDSNTIERYEQTGGYTALRKGLLELGAEKVAAEVKSSNIRGRGGANFPAGVKWGFLARARPAYLVINADESEPGTFKDRQLLERDPHQLIEGVILTSFAVGVNHAFIYVRGEYPKPARRVQRAVEEAYAKGYLGTDILGSGFNLDVTVHLGAGAYICGEESALLNSLEGSPWRATAEAAVPGRGRPLFANRPSSTMSRRSRTSHGSSTTVGRPTPASARKSRQAPA